MAERHLKRAPFPEQDRAVDDIGLIGRQFGQLQIDFAGTQRAEPVGEQALDGLHSAGGVPVPEHLGGLDDQVAAPRPGETDAYRARNAAHRRGRAADRLADLPVARFEFVAQLFADRREPHDAAGALEQLSADGPLLLFNRLAHPGRSDVQPLRGTAEVKLLGEGQEDLDVAELHWRLP